MITEVPSPDDFRATGCDHINLGADQALELLYTVRASGLDDANLSEERAEFWKASQRQLANALALVQQGTEFLIKAGIASVSPYLLLSGKPKDWPNGADKADTPFSRFYTLDAQDLIRAYNTVTSPRISSGFAQRFGELRARRNTIMHGVDPSLTVAAVDVLVYGLEAIEEFVGTRKWISLRRQYLFESPSSYAGAEDYIETDLVEEGRILVELLSSRDLARFFGFNKRQRRYVCPICLHRDEADGPAPTTAQLSPNKPNGTNVFCFVCEQDEAVLRRQCDNPECPGNVIHVDTGMCLTCLEGIT